MVSCLFSCPVFRLVSWVSMHKTTTTISVRCSGHCLNYNSDTFCAVCNPYFPSHWTCCICPWFRTVNLIWNVIVSPMRILYGGMVDNDHKWHSIKQFGELLKQNKWKWWVHNLLSENVRGFIIQLFAMLEPNCLCCVSSVKVA